MDAYRIPDPLVSWESSQQYTHADLTCYTTRGLHAERWRAQAALAALVGEEPTTRHDAAWDWWWERIQAVQAALTERGESSVRV